MNIVFRKLESFFDRMIVPALLVLILIIVADIFFTEFKYSYERYFFYADLFVLGVFVGDLSFKLRAASTFEGFLKDEWLEIIAVVPFFWIFRLLESVVRIGEIIQEILHLVARGGRFARLFAAFNISASRDDRFAMFLRKITRTDWFDEAAKFYRHPKEYYDDHTR